MIGSTRPSRQSSARSAYPSIAELLNEGRFHGAVTSSASTRPSDSSSSTRSASSGVICFRMMRRASSNAVIKPSTPSVRLLRFVVAVEGALLRRAIPAAYSRCPSPWPTPQTAQQAPSSANPAAPLHVHRAIYLPEPSVQYTRAPVVHTAPAWDTDVHRSASESPPTYPVDVALPATQCVRN